jgi:choline dehydrogenase
VRGTDGAFHVTDVASPHALSRQFVQAAAEADVPVTKDYNGLQHEGASLAQTSVHRGRRVTAWRAFLAPAQRRRNLQVLTGTRAQSVVIEGGRAVAVEVADGRGVRRIAARREVILAAGAIGSPQPLMLSGVGPRSHLDALGIPVHCDVPGVGENLQEHSGVWIVCSLRAGIRTANMDYNAWGKLRHGLRWLLTGGGIAASPSAQAIAFVKTDPSLADPDVQIHFMPLGYHIHPEGVEVMRIPAMMAVPNINRPLSRGRIRLPSSDPSAPPRIEPRLLERMEDVRTLTAGARLVRKIFATSAFAPYLERETFPGPAVTSDAQWEQILRRHTNPVYHVAGTCRMGTDALAVVDSRLRVRVLRACG